MTGPSRDEFNRAVERSLEEFRRVEERIDMDERKLAEALHDVELRRHHLDQRFDRIEKQLAFHDQKLDKLISAYQHATMLARLGKWVVWGIAAAGSTLIALGGWWDEAQSLWQRLRGR